MVCFKTSEKVLPLFLIVLVFSGCSIFPWGQDGKPSPEHKSPQGWRFFDQQQVKIEAAPAAITAIAGETGTLQGECFMGPKLLDNVVGKRQKGLFVPVLKVAEDMTLAPDLENSTHLYQSIKKAWRLASPGESFQFYQKLLASVEHNCPANATKEAENCSFKKIAKFGGLFGQDTVYDVGRLERWFDSHPSVAYYIMGTAQSFNSSAMLHSRYSANSRVLTRATQDEREKDIGKSYGQLKLDWAVPSESGPLFKSLGYCRLHWLELEEKPVSQEISHLGIAERQRLNQAMVPYFIQFLENAWVDFQENN